MSPATPQPGHHARGQDLEDVVRRSTDAGAVQAELQFADITGALKSVFIPVRRLRDVMTSGEWFDGSAIEGSVRELESDMYLRPDPATFSLTEPTAEPVCARLLCDIVTPDGRPYAGDTRSVLRRVLEQAHGGGLDYLVAPEVEFFLFPGDADRIELVNDDPGSYFERSRGRTRQVELQIVAALERMGVNVESSHHEVATGQFEVDLPLQPALLAADALTTLKPAIKELAQQFGLQASFMPKPLMDAAGSGMHVHQVACRDAGDNVFQDSAHPYGLSLAGRAFAAGQLEHAPGMCALLAPLVNSYKRLVPGYEAPVAGSWGRRNRSALIRVPALPDDPQTAMDLLGTRLELRLPDPSCNAYLAFAAMLATGLDGLERELELGPPMEEIEHGYQGGSKLAAHPLPGSLGEALDALDQDDVVAEALGSEVLNLFRATKAIEWATYRRQVTPWELEAYLKKY